MPDEEVKPVDPTLAGKTFTIVRSGKRRSVTNATRAIGELQNPSRDECLFHIDKLETLKGELKLANETLTNHMLMNEIWDETKFMAETDTADEYDESIRNSIFKLRSILKTLDGDEEVVRTPESTKQVSHKVTLPHIELPSFDGEPESFNKFIVSFENLISKYNLSSYEKFSYLSKQLMGDAKKLIESLELEECDYESALKMLKEAYFDKVEQQYSILEKLSNLRLEPDAVNGISWIGDAKILMAQIVKNEISSEIFTQYFLWSSLNESFRNHITAICQKTNPSLQEIRDCMFPANARYVKEFKSKNRNAESETIVAATSVGVEDGTLVKCSLCSNDKTESSHKLSRCPVYSEPGAKIAKLKAVGGCTKCGAISHNFKKCFVKFNKKCFFCRQWHMSFLCPGSNKKSNDKKTKGTYVGTITNVLTESDLYNDVILPTATIEIKNNGEVESWRVFKDIGSQSSFVKGSPKDIPNCKIIKNLNLNIKGINGVETYSTHVVEFPIDIPGQGEQTITAICLPSLNVNVTVPGLLELSNLMKSKGLNLADKQIDSDVLKNFKILIGSDQGHILPIKQHNLGESVFYETPSGIMLAGSAKTYFKNKNRFGEIVHMVSE